MVEPKEVLTQLAAATPATMSLWIAVKEVPIEKWLALTSIIVLLLQAAYGIWKWRREARKPE